MGKVQVYENLKDLSSIPRTYVKMLAIVAWPGNSRAGEAETNGYLGLTGQPALANEQTPDSVSDPASKNSLSPEE